MDQEAKPLTTGQLLESWRTAERAVAASERLAAAAERAAAAAERAAAAAEKTAEAALLIMEVAHKSSDEARQSAEEARTASGDARDESTDIASQTGPQVRRIRSASPLSATDKRRASRRRLTCALTMADPNPTATTSPAARSGGRLGAGHPDHLGGRRRGDDRAPLRAQR